MLTYLLSCPFTESLPFLAFRWLLGGFNKNIKPSLATFLFKRHSTKKLTDNLRNVCGLNLNYHPLLECLNITKYDSNNKAGPPREGRDIYVLVLFSLDKKSLSTQGF